jgi:quercetin dioxygenase-like cupin family protein
MRGPRRGRGDAARPSHKPTPPVSQEDAVKQFLLACALAAAGPTLAQQAPPAAPNPHGAHGIPAAATATFRANVLLETPLLGTERRIYRLYTIDFGPGGATLRHMHPGDEIALVTEGAVVLEMQGEEPRTFHVGQTFHPRPMTPHIARNASATAPARVTVSSITEAGKPSTILVPLTN